MSIQQVFENPQDWVAYFGYGSLVNDRTRNAESFGISGRLQGFRRQWSMRSHDEKNEKPGLDGVTVLSVKQDEGSALDGLLVFDKKSHLPNVDKREHNYDRVQLDLANFDCEETLPTSVDAYIYVGHAHQCHFAQENFPIIQSYIDAVLQGFLHKFGADGLKRFMEETCGWDRPILLDRATPLYPRHVQLSANEQELIDYQIKASGATLLEYC